jgi:phosphoenolpyruvate carboxykinase (ATP)
VWLLNTGWSGGAYGVGSRIKLAHTRAIIDGIHNGALSTVRTVRDPVFGFNVVPECLGVPGEVLLPRKAWADKAAYDSSAKKLFQLFKNNFKNYEGGTRATVVADAAA